MPISKSHCSSQQAAIQDAKAIFFWHLNTFFPIKTKISLTSQSWSTPSLPLSTCDCECPRLNFLSRKELHGELTGKRTVFTDWCGGQDRSWEVIPDKWPLQNPGGWRWPDHHWWGRYCFHWAPRSPRETDHHPPGELSNLLCTAVGSDCSLGNICNFFFMYIHLAVSFLQPTQDT